MHHRSRHFRIALTHQNTPMSEPNDPVLASYDRALAGWEHRLLGFIQDNPAYPYFGSLDRGYWHYRATSGFSSVMYQISMLSLAIGAISASVPSQQARLLRLTQAALLFWSKTQHRDGTHDEWYVNEHSYAATAFGSFAASEALLMLRDSAVPLRDEAPIIDAIERAASWLTKRSDPHVSNHTAGGIAAIHNAGILTGRTELLDVSTAQLRDLEATQHAEGWFPEYGGFDPGYLTVTIGYLASYVHRGGHEIATKILRRAIDTAARGVNPDGSFGGPYGSRNTKFLMPHGLELVHDQMPTAGWILESTLGIGHHQLVTPSTADDRYFAFFFLWSYLWARSARTTRLGSSTTTKPPNLTPDLKEAGLIRRVMGPWQLAVNVHKGAALSLYHHRELAAVEAGYAAHVRDGQWATSQALTPPLDVKIEERDDNISISVTKEFHAENPRNPLDTLAVPFSIYTASIARIATVAYRIGDWIKSRQVRRKTPMPLLLERHIDMTNDQVQIVDLIHNTGKRIDVELVGTGDTTTMHNPSSRFSTFPGTKIEPTKSVWRGHLDKGSSIGRRLLISSTTEDLTDEGLTLLNKEDRKRLLKEFHTFD